MKAVLEARQKRLNECLLTLAKWCENRASGTHDQYTTLTMLRRKVSDIENSVTRAGWRAADSEPNELTEKDIDELKDAMGTFFS